VLAVPPSTLAEWNGEFDREMNPVQRPDGRGAASQITAETVRQVVAAARQWQASGQPMRLDRFTEHLAKEHAIHLSRAKVTEILVANDLHQVQIRNRRPRFYQSLRQAIPNGLVGVDGSAFTVWVDRTPHRFNVEGHPEFPSQRVLRLRHRELGRGIAGAGRAPGEVGRAVGAPGGSR
jgi:hypothetical protein